MGKERTVGRKRGVEMVGGGREERGVGGRVEVVREWWRWWGEGGEG